MFRPQLFAVKFLALGLSLAILPLPIAIGQINFGGDLRVNGTAAANNITFAIEAGEVVVVVDGAESRFDLAQVDELTVRTFAGDDRVVNNTPIPMLAVGGGGDDFIVGGSGDDELLGQGGEDSLFGRDGQDELDGGADVDYLSGGNGDDFLVSQFLTDDMFGGPGDDRLIGGVGSDANRRVLILSGGPGNDTIDFNAFFSNGNVLDTTTVSGGPGFDMINGELAEVGVFLRNDGQLFASGGADDDSIAVTLEGGMLVVRVENSTTAIQETYDPGEVVSIRLKGFEGDDVLVNSSDTRANLFGGPGDDLSMTNTDFDSCVNDGEGGNDVYVLHGGEVRHDVLENDGFDAITVIGSERDELVIFGTPTFFPGPIMGVSQIDLGAGDDVYAGSSNRFAGVTVRGEGGDDTIIGGNTSRVEKLFGDAGNDVIDGNSGSNVIYGGPGDDLIRSRSSFGSDSLLFGGAGNDTIESFNTFGVESTMFGGPGNDTIEGFEGKCRMFGGIGDDTLFGGASGDILRGDGGDDFINGFNGDDVMFGGAGNDMMLGGNNGDDVLRGEGGNDTLDGGAEDDLLFGGPGNDDLSGGDGDDRLNGDAGNDTLDGGSGVNVLNQ